MGSNRTFEVKMYQQPLHQIYMLVAMFLLGMAVNIIGMPSEVPGVSKVFSGIFTGFHALIGVGLTVGAILIVRYGYKSDSNQRSLTRAGLASIVLAFASGVTMLATDNDWWSFAMAAAFIAAFLIYGAVRLRMKK